MTDEKLSSDAVAAMRKDRNIVAAYMPPAEVDRMKALKRDSTWKAMKGGPQRSTVVRLL